jgi:hypothetical protein
VALTMKQFFDERNQMTRIDILEQVGNHELAALREFARRIGAPHLIDEVILPILHEGDSQIVIAVQDRPWPPWGLGARRISALCQTHLVSDASHAISPVHVTDADLTNIGMISAVFKEALEQLAVDPRAEICYLVAEGSTLVDHVLTSLGFTRTEDVFVTWAGRYYTYRAPVGEVLKNLGLDQLGTADLLAHDMPSTLLEKNALFHQTMLDGARAEWAAEGNLASEIARLVRGGHASKPGGVPSGSGRFPLDPSEFVTDPFFVWISNLLGGGVTDPVPVSRLVDYAVRQEPNFTPASVVPAGAPGVVVDERLRRARTLDDLGEFEAQLTDRIKAQLQTVFQRLHMQPFPIGRIEMQLTASGDGDYFRLHRDTDEQDTRALSFVYFFHGEPRRFSGGELRIYPSRVVGGQVRMADHAHTLSPRQDAIVFFPPLNDHEILPVRVPSGQFADSRFTINGWIHRA